MHIQSVHSVQLEHGIGDHQWESYVSPETTNYHSTAVLLRKWEILLIAAIRILLIEVQSAKPVQKKVV